jgi:hypothetical protein
MGQIRKGTIPMQSPLYWDRGDLRPGRYQVRCPSHVERCPERVEGCQVKFRREGERRLRRNGNKEIGS